MIWSYYVRIFTHYMILYVVFVFQYYRNNIAHISGIPNRPLKDIIVLKGQCWYRWSYPALQCNAKVFTSPLPNKMPQEHCMKTETDQKSAIKPNVGSINPQSPHGTCYMATPALTPAPSAHRSLPHVTMAYAAAGGSAATSSAAPLAPGTINSSISRGRVVISRYIVKVLYLL